MAYNKSHSWARFASVPSTTRRKTRLQGADFIYLLDKSDDAGDYRHRPRQEVRS